MRAQAAQATVQVDDQAEEALALVRDWAQGGRALLRTVTMTYFQQTGRARARRDGREQVPASMAGLRGERDGLENEDAGISGPS